MNVHARFGSEQNGQVLEGLETVLMENARKQADIKAAYRLTARHVPLDDSWDVIVVGGGPAGSAAAAAAAGQGARTLLLERAGALGGMGTLGLVPWFCGYGDGERIIARGIAEQVRTGLRTGMPALAAAMEKEPLYPPAIDPELLKRIYDRLVTEAGASVLFQSLLCSVEMADNGAVDALLVSSKAGLRAYRARIYVDGTGDGDLAAWAGAAFEKGDADGRLQPATHCFTLTNVEPYECWYDPDAAGAAEPRNTIGPSLHFFDPDSPVHKAVASDRFPLIDDEHSCSMQIGARAYGYNFGHLCDVDNTDPASVSRALMQGRRQAAQYRDALAEFHPAFENAFLAATGSLMGVRESRRITGDCILALDDYLARRRFPDEVCRNAYSIDVHGNEKSPAGASAADIEKTKERIARKVRQLGKGESYGVPYRCLTPRGLRNVLVAGRCISTDRYVNGSVRIMACCLTTGQAAGIAAAMAAAASGDVHAVDTDRLRAALIRDGAWLP